MSEKQEDEEPGKHEKAVPPDPVAPIHVGAGPIADGSKTEQEQKLEDEKGEGDGSE